ncbi:MAG: tetratricopeptide repeat protein [Faecousia sp.]
MGVETQQTQSMEAILKTLIRKKGLDYLRSGSYFINAFEELGGTAADTTLLRYLAQSGGHIALLDAEEQSPAMRQTVYSQTVKKVCDRTLISPELSHKVCGAFWRAVYNEEPPAQMEKLQSRERPAPPDPVLSPEEMYQRGWACALRKDWKEAVKWYRMAAEQGDPYGQDRLGDCYRWGDGVSADPVQAVFWYRKAAEQGNPFAQYHLSQQYESGSGVEKDLSQAIFWCRKAADKYVPGASEQLAQLEAKLAAQTKPLSLSEKRAPVVPPDRKPQPAADKEDFSLCRPEHSEKERWLLMLGWGCLVLALLYWGYACIVNGPSGILGSFALLALLFFLPVLRKQLLLWKRVKSWKPKGMVNRILYEIWEGIGAASSFVLVMEMALLPFLYIVIGPEIIFGLVFVPYGIYHVWWYRWQKRLNA